MGKKSTAATATASHMFAVWVQLNSIETDEWETRISAIIGLVWIQNDNNYEQNNDKATKQPNPNCCDEKIRLLLKKKTYRQKWREVELWKNSFIMSDLKSCFCQRQASHSRRVVLLFLFLYNFFHCHNGLEKKLANNVYSWAKMIRWSRMRTRSRALVQSKSRKVAIYGNESILTIWNSNNA